MRLVRIHPPDDDGQAAARQHEICQRLDQLGSDAVRLLFANGGLPTNWNPIVIEWLWETRP